MDRFNDRWEEEMKSAVPKSADYVKAKLAMELEIYKKSSAINDSAINDSINKIEGVGANFSPNSSSNEKRLVRTMESSNMPNNSFANDNLNRQSYTPVNYNGMNYDDDNGKSFFGSGYSTVLILSFTVALVVLVFIVSLFFANYF